jgi:hypothetical protein
MTVQTGEFGHARWNDDNIRAVAGTASANLCMKGESERMTEPPHSPVLILKFL